MPGNPLVRFDEGRVGRIARCRLLSYSTERSMAAMSENAIAQQTVDAAYRVHTVLGPGLLESVYKTALPNELEKRGLHVARLRVSEKFTLGSTQTW